MNSDILKSTRIKKPYRREYLPLLRGMFVCPEPVKKLKNLNWNVTHFSSPEEELFLTADEGVYLGE